MDANSLQLLDEHLSKLGTLEQPPPDLLSEAAKSTLRLLDQDPSGLTLNVSDISVPLAGFMVGLLPWQHRQGDNLRVFGSAGYRQDPCDFVESFVVGGIQLHWEVLEKFKLYLGLWRHDGRYHLDASRRCRTLEEAQGLAEIRNQIAVYDLTEREEWMFNGSRWQRH
jgi:hypothetical protein